MTITKAQSEEMLKAARPLMKWMAENTHLNCHAVVDTSTVKLSEELATQHTDEFFDQQYLPGEHDVVLEACGLKESD